MGKKIPGVSYLFGKITRKKTSSQSNDIDQNLNGDEASDSSSNGGGGITPARTSYSGESSSRTSIEDQQQQQQQQLKPGRHHMRTASCHQHNGRSSASKLVWSLSSGFLGGAQTAVTKLKRGEKKLTHEDSIWKKTIILGERCRVPDEDDDTILYDENGNRFSTYHPKSNTNGIMSFSRQNSGIDQSSITTLDAEKLSRR